MAKSRIEKNIGFDVPSSGRSRDEAGGQGGGPEISRQENFPLFTIHDLRPLAGNSVNRKSKIVNKRTGMPGNNAEADGQDPPAIGAANMIQGCRRPVFSHCALVIIVCALFASATAGCFNSVNTIVIPSGPEPLEEKVLVSDGPDKILLIDVMGVISDAQEESVLTSRPSLIARMKEELEKAEKDDDVKAVLLRINSPGGTVTASDILYHELTEFKHRTGRKVVASIVDIGASGAYYTAVAADRIIAHPTTVTGSIGVIMLNLNVEGLLEKIGVSGIAIKSADKKDMGSPFRKMTDEERAVFQGVIDHLFDRFVAVVAEGRPNLSEAQIRKAADGRIYTAQQALDLGLIDQIGYMDDAIAATRKEAGLDRASLVTYIRPGSYRANVYTEAPAAPAAGTTVNLINMDLRSALPAGMPQFMYLWVP